MSGLQGSQMFSRWAGCSWWSVLATETENTKEMNSEERQKGVPNEGAEERGGQSQNEENGAPAVPPFCVSVGDARG